MQEERQQQRSWQQSQWTRPGVGPGLAAWVILGVLLVASSAGAVPLSYSVNDRSTVLTAGSTSTETPLADALADAGYAGGFAAGDQTVHGLFSPASSDPSAGLLVEYAGYRDHNELGIYNLKGDEIVLFAGGDDAGASVELVFSGEALTVDGQTVGDFGQTFGFYLRNEREGFTWTSQDIGNPGERAHFLGYLEAETLYFGFEDLDLGDRDYNDLVAKMSGITGARPPGSGPPVPEPGAALAFAVGLVVARAGLARRRS